MLNVCELGQALIEKIQASSSEPEKEAIFDEILRKVLYPQNIQTEFPFLSDEILIALVSVAEQSNLSRIIQLLRLFYATLYGFNLQEENAQVQGKLLSRLLVRVQALDIAFLSPGDIATFFKVIYGMHHQHFELTPALFPLVQSIHRNLLASVSEQDLPEQLAYFNGLIKLLAIIDSLTLSPSQSVWHSPKTLIAYLAEQSVPLISEILRKLHSAIGQVSANRKFLKNVYPTLILLRRGYHPEGPFESYRRLLAKPPLNNEIILDELILMEETDNQPPSFESKSIQIPNEALYDVLKDGYLALYDLFYNEKFNSNRQTVLQTVKEKLKQMFSLFTFNQIFQYSLEDGLARDLVRQLYYFLQTLAKIGFANEMIRQFEGIDLNNLLQRIRFQMQIRQPSAFNTCPANGTEMALFSWLVDPPSLISFSKQCLELGYELQHAYTGICFKEASNRDTEMDLLLVFRNLKGQDQTVAIGAEINGAVHLAPIKQESDLRRQNFLAQLGLILVEPISPAEIKSAYSLKDHFLSQLLKNRILETLASLNESKIIKTLDSLQQPKITKKNFRFLPPRTYLCSEDMDSSIEDLDLAIFDTDLPFSEFKKQLEDFLSHYRNLHDTDYASTFPYLNRHTPDQLISWITHFPVTNSVTTKSKIHYLFKNYHLQQTMDFQTLFKSLFNRVIENATSKHHKYDPNNPAALLHFLFAITEIFSYHEDLNQSMFMALLGALTFVFERLNYVADDLSLPNHEFRHSLLFLNKICLFWTAKALTLLDRDNISSECLFMLIKLCYNRSSYQFLDKTVLFSLVNKITISKNLQSLNDFQLAECLEHIAMNWKKNRDHHTKHLVLALCDVFSHDTNNSSMGLTLTNKTSVGSLQQQQVVYLGHLQFSLSIFLDYYSEIAMPHEVYQCLFKKVTDCITYLNKSLSFQKFIEPLDHPEAYHCLVSLVRYHFRDEICLHRDTFNTKNMVKRLKASVTPEQWAFFSSEAKFFYKEILKFSEVNKPILLKQINKLTIILNQVKKCSGMTFQIGELLDQQFQLILCLLRICLETGNRIDVDCLYSCYVHFEIAQGTRMPYISGEIRHEIDGMFKSENIRLSPLNKILNSEFSKIGVTIQKLSGIQKHRP